MKKSAVTDNEVQWRAYNVSKKALPTLENNKFIIIYFLRLFSNFLI